MIQLTPQMRLLVAIDPVDFRKGIDGLARECRAVLHSNPLEGAVFVFRNRRATAIKLLFYDSQGYWLCQKRLSKGRFSHWPRAGDDQAMRQLDVHELQLLLWNGDVDSIRASPPWRRVAISG